MRLDLAAAVSLTLCAPTLAHSQVWAEPDRSEVNRFVRDHLNRPIKDLMGALSQGLGSQSPGMRGGALTVITARCAFPQWLYSPLKESYPSDIKRMKELAPMVEPLLADRSAEVRHEAVKAYSCLMSDLESGGWRLAQATVDRLLQRYLLETSASVRSEISKTLALSTNDTPEIRRHLLGLLASSNVADRSQGEIALRRFYPRERFSQLLACITDADSQLRHACAMALSFYPDDAVAHLPKLEARLKSEPDPQVRRQLELTVDLLKRWRKGLW